MGNGTVLFFSFYGPAECLQKNRILDGRTVVRRSSVSKSNTGINNEGNFESYICFVLFFLRDELLSQAHDIVAVAYYAGTS